MNHEQDNNQTGWESDSAWGTGYVAYQEITPDITSDIPSDTNSYDSAASNIYTTNTNSNNNGEGIQPDDNQKANILCAISLACELLPIIASTVFMSLISSANVSDTSSALDLLMDIMGSIGSLAMIAGLIIMIYVRVKYPKNVFGKVLMWLFIVGAIIAVIIAILYAILLAVACYSCFSCISEFR
ncbi:MAG: hypothetical protein E7292_06820 [Lachnospiraceae bacterium]|nr:hypothetical protein [Lachnospiraceae bacterium]